MLIQLLARQEKTLFCWAIILSKGYRLISARGFRSWRLVASFSRIWSVVIGNSQCWMQYKLSTDNKTIRPIHGMSIQFSVGEAVDFPVAGFVAADALENADLAQSGNMFAHHASRKPQSLSYQVSARSRRIIKQGCNVPHRFG